MFDRDLLILYAESLAAEHRGQSVDVWRRAGLDPAQTTRLVGALEDRLKADSLLSERLSLLVANALAAS